MLKRLIQKHQTANNLVFLGWEVTNFDFVVENQTFGAFSADWKSIGQALDVVSWFVWVWENNEFASFVVFAQRFWA